MFIHYKTRSGLVEELRNRLCINIFRIFVAPSPRFACDRKGTLGRLCRKQLTNVDV